MTCTHPSGCISCVGRCWKESQSALASSVLAVVASPAKDRDRIVVSRMSSTLGISGRELICVAEIPISKEGMISVYSSPRDSWCFVVEEPFNRSSLTSCSIRRRVQSARVSVSVVVVVDVSEASPCLCISPLRRACLCFFAAFCKNG